MTLQAAQPAPSRTRLERPARHAPVRVLICDDSAVIRSVLARILSSDPDVRVVARAANGAEALAAIRAQEVDVVVLDVEMPVMDGLAALPLLLQANPALRVIMASTLTTRGADITFRALRLGAADYIAKPSAAEIGDDGFRKTLTDKVKALALGAPPAAAALPATRPAPRLRPLLLAIGSSTGGPQALFALVPQLGKLPVPVVLTQHMPKAFTPLLAEHLSKLGGMSCTEAIDGERLSPGHIYLAPGDRHLCIDTDSAWLRARLGGQAPENFCRPSVDPMLRSLTASCKGRALLVMLTGMGQDGLSGTRELVAAGGTAIAQDAASSVVWGMPGAIAQAGLCHAVLPLAQMAASIRTVLATGAP